MLVGWLGARCSGTSHFQAEKSRPLGPLVMFAREICRIDIIVCFLIYKLVIPAVPVQFPYRLSVVLCFLGLSALQNRIVAFCQCHLPIAFVHFSADARLVS